MSATTDFAKPKYITGGCLCGALKYRVDFPEDHDFLDSSCTCQCTQDRKCTGSLWFPGHRVRGSSAFKFTTSTETLKHYSASPEAQRGFCGDCGSFLYWKPKTGAPRVTIAVGTVDPLFLFGEGADGEEVPKGGFGFALANGGGSHEWCSNEIKGVTDKIGVLGFERGKRWEGDSQ